METCETHIEIRAPLPISDALVFVSYVVWFCCHILWHIASDFLTSKTFGKQYWIRKKNVNILTLIKFIRNRHISVALLILLVPVKVAKLVTHCYSSHDFLIRQNGIKKRNIKGDSVMPFSKLANRRYAVFSLPYTQTHTSEIHWKTNCRFQANFMLRIRKFNHYIYRYKRKPAPFVGAITAFQLSWGKSFEKIYYYQTHNFIGFKSKTYI